MGTSKFGIVAMAAGLVAVSGPTVQARPDLPGVKLVALSDLPRSPEEGVASEFGDLEERCDFYRAKDLGPAGRQVESLGWKVTSEAPLGRYQVVSFVSGFVPSTNALCFMRNGNIGVFDGARLVALAYAPDGSDVILGTVEPLESGALMIWGGDFPGPPLGELQVEGDRLRLTDVAAEQTFCEGAVTVPNVYGQSIYAARKQFIAHGWRPVPPEEAPDEYSSEGRLAGRGVIEADACANVGYCAFNYRGAGRALWVTTVGGPDEPDNVVAGYGVTCRGDETSPAG